MHSELNHEVRVIIAHVHATLVRACATHVLVCVPVQHMCVSVCVDSCCCNIWDAWWKRVVLPGAI